ncbi:MAG: DUF2798 domain-containing protein [Hyphomicrobiaceae bacterium]|nr:DUF2798 domain-containing protein [Hyphomicrobiaceae bacterium]
MTSQDMKPRRPALPRWLHPFVMPLLLSVFMTAVVSAISTVKALGLKPGIVSEWLLAWAWSWLIAFPTLLLVLPLVRRLTALLTAQPGSPPAAARR